jgi:hypothetical protein
MPIISMEELPTKGIFQATIIKDSIVRDHKGLGCNIALIKCTLDSGKPKGGWNFGREGTGGQMGNRGS